MACVKGMQVVNCVDLNQFKNVDAEMARATT